MFSQIIIGLLLGYVLSSLLETLIHKYILHAPEPLLRFWKKYPKVFRAFIQERMIHELHHSDTYKHDHVTQFENSKEREELDESLSELDKELFDHIKETEYGLFAQPKGLFYIGILTTVLFTIPMYFLFDAWVIVGALIPMYFLAFFMSRVIHPYTHDSYDEALSKSSYPVRILLRTWYFQKAVRYHYVHHIYDDYNYNLVLGFDYLVGWGKNENSTETRKMESIGIKTSTKNNKPLQTE